ncbi:MAG TPA: hypothetical protein VKK79_00980, partial [Candidatus Lokiarchaeia archaeon]|nr:hypothetical protein [Candidatus Lokiarchaeia archaeon]
DVINGRPVYFRAEALDALNNLGTSPAATVAQMSAFTPWELVVAILLTALMLIMVGYGLTRLVKRRSVKNPPADARSSQGSRLECSTRFASAHARELLLLFFPAIMLGTWVAAWGVVKGFFGASTITNLLPAASGYPNWNLTLHNNIFDFFGPDFFIGTLIVALAMFALIPAITSQRYRAKHLALASLGMALVPLMGVLLFPILFLISGAPVTYYGQILSFAGVIYSLVPTGIYAGTYQILIWFAIPVIIAGVGAPCAVEGGYWIWKKVIPRSWQEYGASFTTRIRGIFCRNAQTVATNTQDKDEIGSEANADE